MGSWQSAQGRWRLRMVARCRFRVAVLRWTAAILGYSSPMMPMTACTTMTATLPIRINVARSMGQPSSSSAMTLRYLVDAYSTMPSRSDMETVSSRGDEYDAVMESPSSSLEPAG